MSDAPNPNFESAASAPGSATWPPDLTEDRSLAGGKIGENYQLLERIGIGGMGVVYRAQQVHPVRRLVAIKLIKLGIDTPQIVARFESERQALALLEHPGISRVYDAGTTDTGRPYFVMEHVAGRPITDYCDERRLNTSARLELFRQVCHAVQHAHYNGILHRDLKPSNMLVTETDRDGANGAQVKIIDFGIAKAIQGAEISPFVTDAGQFVGTPVYTSPEQATGDDVDTRADIYSLGVVLYELLSGALPFDHSSYASREIHSATPPRPSARLSTIGAADATKFASLRGADSSSLRRQLRGDLDRIVLKAMHPDRSQRYDSAAALAEDIRRYLTHEPILARPPTLAYEARKFARRNRALVTAIAMVIAAIVAGGVAATVGMLRAKQALAREAQSRQVSQNVTQFLSDMLGSVDPAKAKGKPVLVRDVLDRAGKDVAARFKNQPVVAAELHAIISNTYHTLGFDELALTHAQAALDLRIRELGWDHPETLDVAHSLAGVMAEMGRNKEAESRLRDVLERRRRLVGPDKSETLKAEEAIALIDLKMERATEAEPLMKHVVDTLLRTRGPDDPETLYAMHNMAGIVDELGRTQEAETLYRDTAERRARVLGADHPSTILTRMNISTIMLRQKRFDEAETVLRDVLERTIRVNGPDHPRTLATMNNLASTLSQNKKLGEAQAMFQDLLERIGRTMSPNHPNALATLGNVARMFDEQHKEAEALSVYGDLYHRALAAEIPPNMIARNISPYGLRLAELGRFAEAEAPLLEAKKQHEAAKMTKGPKYREVLSALIKTAETTNRPADAQRFRDELARVTAATATMPASQPGR